jgi:hypothetical protein
MGRQPEPENRRPKTLIFRDRKIPNGILYTGESAMGKVSSATLKWLIQRI